MNNKSAAIRIPKGNCLPFGRAVDSEREKLLLGDEYVDFDVQASKDKLIGFTVTPIWMSTSKLTDDAILTLPVMADV